MANKHRGARALGWFSLGLGLPQVAAPESFARFIGLSGDEESQALVRFVGLRELIAGTGILVRTRPVGWLWARVAGDAMDLALLTGALNSKKTDHDRLALATAAVVGVTLLDLRAAIRLSRGATTADHGIHVQQTITVGRSPEEVYAFWHNFENLPRFMDHLEAVQVLSGQRSHWKAKAPAGTSVEWDADIVDDRPNELIAWRSLDGADVDNAGSVRFTAAPGGRGTEVHVELTYNPPAGKLGAVVAKLFGEEPKQQISSDLRRFKQVIETGEVIQSDSSIHSHGHAAQPPQAKARG